MSSPSSRPSAPNAAILSGFAVLAATTVTPRPRREPLKASASPRLPALAHTTRATPCSRATAATVSLPRPLKLRTCSRFAGRVAVPALLAPCFTQPTFQTFRALLVGQVSQTGRRTVCGMLIGARLSGVWEHSRAHRFFSRARWQPDQLGLALAGLI